MRLILLLHRYLALVVGLLMVLWCLSGFVMLYQGFPALSRSQYLAGLAPLDFSQCCNHSLLEADDTTALPPFRIEMLLGDPVLQLSGGDVVSMVNLRTGQPVPMLSEEQVLEVARQYGTGNDITGTPRTKGVIDIDQWTIQTAARNRPAHHIAFDDAADTEIYINGSTGAVFQVTNRRTRFLSWLGAVPHWLYPTLLRQNGPLWSQVVIWTSVAGSFLAATGLYVGIARLRRSKRTGKLNSPFRGWWYWHHMTGLVFGVVALTWVFSGLLTMNPWGVLSGTGTGNDYRRSVAGTATWGELRVLLDALPSRGPTASKQLQSAPFDQRLYVVARHEEQPTLRLDLEGRLALLTHAEVETALAQLPVPIQKFTLLEQEDAYYYGHKQAVALPVYRILLDDAEQTRLYIDQESGTVRTLDASGRLARWIRTGLHDFDFPVVRLRPVWDITVLFLLGGVTGLCLIGTWLAYKRARMDLRRLRGRWHRYIKPQAPLAGNLERSRTDTASDS